MLCKIDPDTVKVTSNYVAVLTEKTWSDARTYCQNIYGTDLAIIRSQNNQNEIESIQTEDNTNKWIGCTDSDSDGNWLWVDGSNVTYDNWGSGEPGNKNCSQVISNGSWKDGSCANLKTFICNS